MTRKIDDRWTKRRRRAWTIEKTTFSESAVYLMLCTESRCLRNDASILDL